MVIEPHPFPAYLSANSGSLCGLYYDVLCCCVLRLRLNWWLQNHCRRTRNPPHDQVRFFRHGDLYNILNDACCSCQPMGRNVNICGETRAETRNGSNGNLGIFIYMVMCKTHLLMLTPPWGGLSMDIKFLRGNNVFLNASRIRPPAPTHMMDYVVFWGAAAHQTPAQR